MLIQIKEFIPVTYINVSSDGKGDKEGHDILFAFYWGDGNDYFPVDEFRVDREGFENNLGRKVKLLDTFQIGDFK